MRNTEARGRGSWLGLPLVTMVLAAACGGDTGTEPQEPDAQIATLSSIQTDVFTPSCATHHGPSGTAAGLDLSAGQSYANLVNVPSTQVALNRVTPGDAENSYLVHKIEGRDGIEGQPMPVGPPLTDEQIAMIRQWINAGAPNN